MKTPYLLPRQAHNRTLVRQRKLRHWRELVRVALAILVVGVALLGYTWLHLESLGSGYRVEGLEQRLHELARRERHLRLEEAYLSSPQRVETRASKELGMRPPELGQLLFSGVENGDARTSVAPPATPTAPVPTTPPPAPSAAAPPETAR